MTQGETLQTRDREDRNVFVAPTSSERAKAFLGFPFHKHMRVAGVRYRRWLASEQPALTDVSRFLCVRNAAWKWIYCKDTP